MPVALREMSDSDDDELEASSFPLEVVQPRQQKQQLLDGTHVSLALRLLLQAQYLPVSFDLGRGDASAAWQRRDADATENRAHHPARLAVEALSIGLRQPLLAAQLRSPVDMYVSS